MEQRLIHAEAVLLALLSQATDAQLASAFQELRRSNDSGPHVGCQLEAVKREKFGSAYWERFPLNSAEEARRWCADRSSTVASTPSSPVQESIDAMVDAPQLEDSVCSAEDYREELLQGSQEPTTFASIGPRSTPSENWGASRNMKNHQELVAAGLRRQSLETSHPAPRNPQLATRASRSEIVSDDYESAYLW